MRTLQRTMILLLLLMFVGCAALRVGENSTKPDRTSGPKPEWVKSDAERKETKDKLYIRVEATGADRDYLRRVSLDAEANEKIVQETITIAERELAEALKGSRSSAAGQAGESVINVLSHATYSSLAREASYWERYAQKNDSDKLVYEYEMYGWYSISLKDFQDAKRRAWDDGVKEISVADKEAKDLLEKSKERFIQGQ